MKPLALLTCASFPELDADDRLLLPALEAEGVAWRVVVWDGPVRWEDFSGALIRSCWDYTLKRPAFLARLEDAERAGLALWNPAATVRWNTSKAYLKDCEAAGLPIVPTLWIPAEGSFDLAAALSAQGWDQTVLKPVVSAGAFRTFRLRAGEDAARALAEARAGCGAMLQPYLPVIEAEGEWSFIFLGGEFSHAVLKTPGRGDFRVQEEHGGMTTAAAAPPELLAQARRALDWVKTPWLYARVDGVRRGRELLLAELELVEPTLFLSRAPSAARALARALARRLRGSA